MVMMALCRRRLTPGGADIKAYNKHLRDRNLPFMKVAIMPAGPEVIFVIFILIYFSRRKFYAAHKAAANPA